MERKDSDRKDGERAGSAPKDGERKASDRKEADRKASDPKTSDRKDADRKASDRKDADRKDAEGKDAAPVASDAKDAERGEIGKVPTIKILSIEPAVIRFQQPFKANWAIEVDDEPEDGNAELTFQTDDARVVLYEHQGDTDAPVAKPVALVAGARIRKTTLLELRLRTGLVGEEVRDGRMAPMSVHARLNGENQRTLAVSTAFELRVADLSERQATKIFL